MACTVEWVEDGSVVRVRIAGVIDAGAARRLSAEVASHVGIDGVEVVEIDTTGAEVADGSGARVLEELSRRFAGAGQRLVITDEALGGGRAAAHR